MYPFGFGLSYTSFKYSNIATKRLADGHYEVECDIQNTGDRVGAAVPQLYVSERKPTVERPSKELKAFARVELAPGETKRVSMDLAPRAFAFYDVARKRWHINSGAYSIQIGESSQHIVLYDNVSLPRAIEIPVGAAIY
jgi:beta-glucosidase